MFQPYYENESGLMLLAAKITPDNAEELERLVGSDLLDTYDVGDYVVADMAGQYRAFFKEIFEARYQR